MIRTRFAPSPTGPLHLGHAYSALLAHDRAKTAKGTFLLRIEDIDRQRARPVWENRIFEDLRWLGLDWAKPVLRQSDRQSAYDNAIDKLSEMHLTYPCSCTRADIARAAEAPQEGGARFGPDGRIYPGTCRGRPMSGLCNRDAIRLDIARATTLVPELVFHESGLRHAGEHVVRASELCRTAGDIVLARRGMGGSYHLCVVVDDACQNITEVTRGEDLFAATPVHVLLQRLLDLPTPEYHHHALIRDEHGKRLAKRDDARAIARYRADGLTPEDIRNRIGLATKGG